VLTFKTKECQKLQQGSKLSERKKKILQYVVDDYIETAVPVSSKSLTEKHLQNISSATVRNELSALEELGYLTQLHTSSGRVPSADAYKLYVSELMVKDKLSDGELDYIKKIFLDKADNMEEVIKNTTKVISELTSYPSVGITAKDNAEKIENIKFFRYRKDQALVLIVTEHRLLKDNYINVPESMSDEQLSESETVLSNMVKGKTFEEICCLEPELEDNFLGYKNIFVNVIEALRAYMHSSDDDVITEGEDKILEHPEYADVGKIKNFLSVVTKKDKIMSLLTEDGKDIEINVKIGSDGYEVIPEDCSLVTATYSANGVKLGTYGVIGPTRMDYQKVVAVLENVGKVLESILSNR
jgi:heat-inducible transcriptional repressor